MMKTENLNLTQDWDKTFPRSDKVKHSKVSFLNRYGITLAADLYIPKTASGKMPAIAVSGPFGAVFRPLRRGQGTVLRPLRPDHGRARLCDAGL